jgi:intracellular sulfur oxidation DsrE/DsrF family protein
MKLSRSLAALLACACVLPAFAADKDLSPYGTAKVDMHKYETINTVWDVNYEKMSDLNYLAAYVGNVSKVMPGKRIVVLHGPEIRVFAKENYEKYQGVVDKMAALSKEGVEFHMCNNAMHGVGYEAKDIVGFVTVIPAGFAEIASLQQQGYRLIIPTVTGWKDARYIDHPELKPAAK